MDDACVVTFDSRTGRVLDENTGSMVDPAGPATLYSAATTGTGGRSLADTDGLGGKCKVSRMGQSEQARIEESGGAQLEFEPYKFSAPWDAPVFPSGAVVDIVSARRDPALPDLEFRVERAYFGTFLVARNYLVAVRTAVPA
jgi:hypothetical protein